MDVKDVLTVVFQVEGREAAHRICHDFKLMKVTVTEWPVSVLPPPSSCQFAPCMLASLSVCVCVRARAFTACILAETHRDRVFLERCFFLAFSLKNLGIWLHHCFWETFPDFWPVSLSLSLSLPPLPPSFSSYKQEQRQWKGTWEAGKREGSRERKRENCGGTSG